MNLKDQQNMILVADDDEEFRLLVRSTLESSHYLVVEADTGESALKKFRSLQPNLVLLDVMMPEINGFDVCKEIRQSPNGLNTPVVMVTSLDDVESIQKAYQLGATDFITKPVDWQMLTLRVNFLLRAYQKIMHSIQIAIDAATNPDIQSKSGIKNVTLTHLENHLGTDLLKEFLGVIDESIKEIQTTDEIKTTKKKPDKRNEPVLELSNMLHLHVQEMHTSIEFVQPYLEWLENELKDIQAQLQNAVSTQNVLLWIQTLLRLKPHCDYTGYKPLCRIIDSELVTQTDNILNSMENQILRIVHEIGQFNMLIAKERSDI